MLYDGVTVHTKWDSNKVKIGDYVTQEIVDDFMDCLPPVCFTRRCSQMGEPYSHREDPNTGRYRPTYLTFSHVEGNVWKYCGHCFCGEIVERGKDPAYISSL